jgi:hypothetical protein
MTSSLRIKIEIPDEDGLKERADLYALLQEGPVCEQRL